MKKINLNKLLQRAQQVRERAYAPYSHYRVGAAVLASSGKIYAGCNVENASYGLTVCAERNAIIKGISEGEREFVALAVVSENGGSPCGACRQVESEFMNAQAPVVLADAQLQTIKHSTVGALLPDGFTPRKLREGQRAAKNRKTTQR
jgi:cytidine deaminase